MTTITHFRVKDPHGFVSTACGLLLYQHIDAAYDPRDVKCQSCQRTRSWKRAVGVKASETATAATRHRSPRVK